MPTTLPRNNRNVLVIAIVIAVILIPLGYSLVSPIFAGDKAGDQVFLEKADAKDGRCVRETTYMRFHHWELLKQVREEVVRYGIRGNVDLAGCRECHTSRERFCDRCHHAVSLSPDCFDCHYYP